MGRNGTAVKGQKVINQINAAISDENVLGVQTYWTLYNNRVNTKEFISAMERYGISECLFRHQTDKKRFLEVAKSVAKSYGTEAKKLVENAGRVVIKIVKAVANVDEENVCDSKFEYEQDTTIIFDNNSGNPIINGEGVAEIIDDVMIRFEAYRDKTSVDFIRLTFGDILRAYGSISLRGSGGIYFIPFKKKQALDAIASLAEEFGLGTVYQIRMPKGVSEKKALEAGVTNELKQRLNLYKERVDNINKPSTIDKKKSEAKKEVAEIFELYSEVLAEATEVVEREVEKKTLFQEIREEYSELEMLLEERMQELEKQA